MAKTLVTLNTSPAFTLVTLNTSPSWSGVTLPTSPSWKLPGSWPDMTVNDWEDETRTWQQIGLLGKDSD
mgnify:FL=1|jgi:hypothetical protein|tara:strand:- start:475 stop:681 length:207 start_codon:yes stop_codon:yes gene_type:complete